MSSFTQSENILKIVVHLFGLSFIWMYICFVKPNGITNFDVMVKNGEHIAGAAYSKGSSFHSTANPFIVCRIPEDITIKREYINMGAGVIKSKVNSYPQKLSTYQVGHLKGKRYWLANRIEALVYVTAHELRHIWQSKMKTKRGYYPKSRGKFSEIDTEGYAITMLRAWRKAHS